MKDLVRISFKKDNATWYAAHGNTVSESATPYYLQQCLENWDKVGIEHNRNMRYGSLFATASLESYQFVNEAALILRYVYYTSGLAAKVVFSVEVLDTTSQEYQPMISSHIDWTSFKDERLRVNVTMLEDSVVTLVKNRENIEYNIPVTGSKVKTVRVKPQHAPGSIRFTSQWPPQNAAPGTLNETITGPSQVYMIYVDKSSIAVDAAPDYVAVVPSPPDNNIGKYTEGQIYTSGIYESNYLFKSTVPLSNVQITGTFHFGVTNAGNPATFRLRFPIEDSRGVGTGLAGEVTQAIAANASVNFSLSVNIGPFTMGAGEHLSMTVFIDDGTHSGYYPVDIAWESDDDLVVAFVNETNTYTVQGLPLLEVARQVVQNVTDNKAAINSSLLINGRGYSSFYDLDPSKLVLVSENSITAQPDANIKISLKTLMDMMDAIMGAGVEINADDPSNVYVAIEERSAFYRAGSNDMIADVEELNDCIFNHADDMVYGELKVGYQVDEYSGTGTSQDNTGRYEYNTMNDYMLPTNAGNKTLELISPVRADGIGLYNTWSDYFLRDKDRNTRSSAGNVGDAKLFLLQITGTKNTAGEDVATYAQDIKSNATVSGLVSPLDMLNPGLTPARCLYRNGKWINSLFFGQDMDSIKWISSELNAGLAANVMAGNVVEKADVMLGALTTGVFYPVYAEFKTAGIKNYMQAFTNNRHGYISFNWQGMNYKMFPIKTSVMLAKPTEYTFRGILCRSNDLAAGIR